MTGGDFTLPANEMAVTPESSPAAVAGRDQEIDRLTDELARARRAEGRAMLAAKRSLALASLQGRILSGAPFERELAAWRAAGGQAGPSSLADHAAEGIATREDLQAEFGPARRAAVAAGRRAEADGAVGRIGAALANLWGIRPARPIAGMSTPAIISRAEEASDAGDIARSLAEIETLRPPAAMSFVQWRIRARARVDAEKFLAEQALALSSEAASEEPMQ